MVRAPSRLRLAGLVAALALAVVGGCATRLFRGRGSTMSCSCADTGCSCSHCTGESTKCPCRGTDAYSKESVGEPR